MSPSNNQIRKLGDRLRSLDCDKSKIPVGDLKLLQEFRMAHKDSLVFVFNELSRTSKIVHKNRIVSFRMKKIDTILSKLSRQKSMELDRMGDIAGCRCIVQSVNAVYEIKRLLEAKFDVKVKDMIENPDPDGYKSLHLYVKSKEHKELKTVEIQIRTLDQHNWATLVEIVDVVYDTKIKEDDKSVPDLNNFLRLYSDLNSLDDKEKNQLIQFDKNQEIYRSLSDTFMANTLKLRREWLTFEASPTQENYLVFEVNQDSKSTSCSIFSTYPEAESYYYDKFKSTEDDLLVTHLNTTDFKYLSVAYSNYILTNHNFQDEWIDFLLEHANKLVEKLDYLNLTIIGHEVNALLKREDSQSSQNLGILDDDLTNNRIGVSEFLKLNKWFDERNELNKIRLNKIEEIGKKLQTRLTELMTPTFWKRIINFFKN